MEGGLQAGDREGPRPPRPPKTCLEVILSTTESHGSVSLLEPLGKPSLAALWRWIGEGGAGELEEEASVGA